MLILMLLASTTTLLLLTRMLTIGTENNFIGSQPALRNASNITSELSQAVIANRIIILVALFFVRQAQQQVGASRSDHPVGTRKRFLPAGPNAPPAVRLAARSDIG